VTTYVSGLQGNAEKLQGSYQFLLQVFNIGWFTNTVHSFDTHVDTTIIYKQEHTYVLEQWKPASGNRRALCFKSDTV